MQGLSIGGSSAIGSSSGLIIRLSVCLALLPMSALAEPADLKDGIYDAYDCSAEVSDQRIELRAGTATFYDYVCRLSDPRALDGVDGAILFKSDCEGEGDKWSEGLVLMQTRDGGLSALMPNWGDHYQRCE